MDEIVPTKTFWVTDFVKEDGITRKKVKIRNMTTKNSFCTL